MSSQATTEFRRRRKENLMKVCGNKCALCGYNKISAALEFHHIDPTLKLYGISSNGNCHDLELDLAEAKKCILLCANCHREVHYDLFSQEELYQKQIYDENYANFLRQDKFLRTSIKEYYCTSCGVKITKYSESGLCADCSHKTRRIIERPNREELKNLIRTMPFTQIGRMYNITDNSIRKWCKAENLPSKVTEIQKYSDQEWEKI